MLHAKEFFEAISTMIQVPDLLRGALHIQPVRAARVVIQQVSCFVYICLFVTQVISLRPVYTTWRAVATCGLKLPPLPFVNPVPWQRTQVMTWPGTTCNMLIYLPTRRDH